jgi:hypothetical protein
MPQVLSAKMVRQANDLMHRYGLGHWRLMATQGYVNYLTQQGIMGKGKELDPDLPPHKSGFPFPTCFTKRKTGNGKTYQGKTGVSKLPPKKLREVRLFPETWSLDVEPDPAGNRIVEQPLSRAFGNPLTWDGLMQLA